MQVNSKEDILNRVKDNISKVLFIESDKILPSSHFINDLGADSMDRTSIMLCLEDEFGKKIDSKLISNINTVDDVINLIYGNLNHTE